MSERRSRPLRYNLHVAHLADDTYRAELTRELLTVWRCEHHHADMREALKCADEQREKMPRRETYFYTPSSRRGW